MQSGSPISRTDSVGESPVGGTTRASRSVVHAVVPGPTHGLAGLVQSIDGFDRLRPFLVNVVSDTDLWMYVSTSGALTAGRNNEDRALFPYETDDKLHQQAGITGPMTWLRVRRADQREPILWRPFHCTGKAVRRRLTKTALGNALCFEEFNDAVGLSFRYTWQASAEFGWVRTCELASTQSAPVTIDVLDGVINLLPANTALGLQRAGSCLINAYSQAELDVPSNLAIYSLASQVADRAEPAEALHANTAFQVGLRDAKYWFTLDQLDAFLEGEATQHEHLLTGRRAAFMVSSRVTLDGTESRRWRVVLDAYRTQSQVVALQTLLNTESVLSLATRIKSSLGKSAEHLARLVANTDGQQFTADTDVCAHHTSNVLFNDLRGGVFNENDVVSAADVRRSISARNQPVASRHMDWLANLPERVPYADLLNESIGQEDGQLRRLVMEYLPLTFGRRHGDPSRPWNRFDIRVTDELGASVLNYQGNWRDIFQNWEALVLGTPVFVESMIAKFVNASTVDGFNPYRVLRDGIEWEVPDPHDPWAHIGYWGDHQIIYLLKLLELSQRVHPELLGQLLNERCFAYANVPYRLRRFEQMLTHRHNTIDFDFAAHRDIESKLKSLGTDARLVRDGDEVLLVTLAEKLLVPALSKLSNFVPGGGIWMNTQRPEWNDANNALVGNGVSVVTLCYLRRYLQFCKALFSAQAKPTFDLRSDVADWFDEVGTTLRDQSPRPDDPEHRRALLCELGLAFERYRERAYARPSTDVLQVEQEAILTFCDAALRHVDASIVQQRRDDGLYHAYNLLAVEGNAIGIDRLQPMLEGQVAVLSSGLLSSDEAAHVVERLFASAMWREDQQSFMLYPVQELPAFLQKNCVDEMAANRSVFARQLLQTGDRSILHRDSTGQIRFNAAFRNARDLSVALDKLSSHSDWAQAVRLGRDELLAVYEKTFKHHAFTGRSGSMYGYEGVGCIYWHMVAKLLLAIQENVHRALSDDPSRAVGERLAALYWRVRDGLGFNKSPEVYGAFPVDAYSHTPLHAGAQQPGMTGQVKEEILTRFGELGVTLEQGRLRFAPALLSADEFLADRVEWNVLGIDGKPRTIGLESGSLGFTFAGTPVVYRLTNEASPRIVVRRHAGGTVCLETNVLDRDTCADLFSRRHDIERIEIDVPRRTLIASLAKQDAQRAAS
jgi:hypothetical protein